MMKRVVFLCALVPAVLSAAWAYEVFEPVQDSFIMIFWYEGEEPGGIDENYGHSIELWVAYFSHPTHYYEYENAVVQFDLSDVEPAMNVIKAYLIFDLHYGGWVWEFFDIEEGWSEMEITWANAPPIGECFLVYDFFPDRRTLSIELPADYVQGWVDYPSENFGFRINAVVDYGYVSSRESATPPP